jgi:hypothetical protein
MFDTNENEVERVKVLDSIQDMALFDHYAGMALAGLLANGDLDPLEQAPRIAFQIAKEVILQRDPFLKANGFVTAEQFAQYGASLSKPDANRVPGSLSIADSVPNEEASLAASRASGGHAPIHPDPVSVTVPPLPTPNSTSAAPNDPVDTYTFQMPAPDPNAQGEIIGWTHSPSESSTDNPPSQTPLEPSTETDVENGIDSPPNTSPTDAATETEEPQQ